MIERLRPRIQEIADDLSTRSWATARWTSVDVRVPAADHRDRRAARRARRPIANSSASGRTRSLLRRLRPRSRRASWSRGRVRRDLHRSSSRGATRPATTSSARSSRRGRRRHAVRAGADEHGLAPDRRGHETTVSLIGNAMSRCSRTPSSGRGSRATRRSFPRAVEELIRYEGPVERTSTAGRRRTWSSAVRRSAVASR